MDFFVRKGIINHPARRGEARVTDGKLILVPNATEKIIEEFRTPNGAILRTLYKEEEFTVVGGGITETVTDFIPAKSLVLGLAGRVTTVIVMATGVNFDVGVASALTRYGENVLLALGTTFDFGNYIDATPPVAAPIFYPTAESILLTGNAGTFTSGKLRLSMFYKTLVAPTS